jgi:hypothetical protein
MPQSGMAVLRAIEWDIVVSKATSVNGQGHMHALAFGCRYVGALRFSRTPIEVNYLGQQPSQVMHVPDDLPDRLRPLIIGELIPYLQAQSHRPYLQLSGEPLKFQGPVVPFVIDADKNMIAGAFEHRKDRWSWALPYVPEHPELWFAAALDDWHQRTPQLVPLSPGWTTREPWMTQDEIATRADLEALNLERMMITEKFNSRELELRSAQSAASAAADGGMRRLLTAQGESLVEATIEALRQLKFGVENVDENTSPGTAKVEDLHLTDPDEPAWTNITEVRGYTGGAKVSDLQRIGRFAALFLQRTGELPNSRWYLVNQFLAADPDTRHAPLAGAEDDVKEFAKDGGLVLDTRELFQLLRAVEAGRIDPAGARRLLRRSTGVFKFDVMGSGVIE